MKEKKNINYYKIITFVLLGLIIIVGSFFGIKSYGNYKYETGVKYGEQFVFEGIVNNIKSNGYVSFGQDNETMTLVSSEILRQQKEQIVIDIMNNVQQQGAVKLFYNETEITLIPANTIGN